MPIKSVKKVVGFLCIVSLLCGCAEGRKDFDEVQSPGDGVYQEQSTKETEIRQQTVSQKQPKTIIQKQPAAGKQTAAGEQSTLKTDAEPLIREVDWSDYFDGVRGAAVVYDGTENCYWIYNQELANTRRSPCSTFKIISSLIGLENQIIVPDDSLREWSGEVFWNDNWNKNMSFEEAFRSSCVWYFREVIDEIGRDRISEELEKLQYGNCDISDWEGRLNTNNSNRALTGFWIESSLKLSPKEQVEVMERIFGTQSAYSEQVQNQLKQVMASADQRGTDDLIYGKTGMGKAHGVVVDAWFTGFSDIEDKRIYFCVYLGESPGAEGSSAKAREIAKKLLASVCSEEF